jgi:hypothetical protein
MSANPDNLIPMQRVWSDEPTPRRRELLWLKEGKVCHWCGCPTRLCDEPDPDQATIEHIMPRCKGGTNDDENLASACRACNTRRSFEDSRNMKEGALLGKWPLTKQAAKKYSGAHVALTGDEKRAILAGTGLVGSKKAEDILRGQRDQGLAAISVLRQKNERLTEDLRLLRKEHALREIVVREQEEELRALRSSNLWKTMRRRLSDWIAP